MARFRISRNTNKEAKQLLQAKLDASLVEEVNLLCKWSGNEKNYVIAELLRYALNEETDFQNYKQSLKQPSQQVIFAGAADAQRRDLST